MRPLYALAATFGLVFLAAPVSALATASAPATDCMGAACDAINRVCDRAFGANCVGQTESLVVAERCMGPVCDAVNAVCWIVLKAWCVG